MKSSVQREQLIFFFNTRYSNQRGDEKRISLLSSEIDTDDTAQFLILKPGDEVDLIVSKTLFLNTPALRANSGMSCVVEK